MKLILLSEHSGHQAVIPISKKTALLATLVSVLILAGCSIALEHIMSKQARLATALLSQLEMDLSNQSNGIAELEERLSLNLEVSAARIARLESRLLRLDALGQRLTDYAALDQVEFNFFEQAGVGGPTAVARQSQVESIEQMSPSEPELREKLFQMSKEVMHRSDQLAVIERVLLRQQRVEEASLFGKPVAKGWVSSNYGMRTDPITGKRAWHNGVDIAGVMGVEVRAIAAGIVTFSGTKSGYGKMVEINHGGGTVSRYGHHRSLAVEVGELVKRGQKIGEMGSSGRSTGPHVHYEIYKNERSVDPSLYIHRARLKKTG
jgi:murein DD-endopeptidase MepM/ murein hydrolase activator NlpD